MSRTNARSRRLRRRPSRTVPATVVALILAVIGILAVVTAVARLADGVWPTQVTRPADTVAALTWGSAAVITAAVVLVVAGVVLLVAGIKPGGFKTAQLAAPEGEVQAVDETDYVISNRALAHLSAARADTVDGVDRVSASAVGRRVRVKVSTVSEQADEIRANVHRRVTESLARAGVTPPPRVSVTVRTKGI